MKWKGFGLEAALLVGATGCSFVDAKVGPALTICATDGQSTASSSGYVGATSGSGASGADGMCLVDAGMACDSCESAHCCATRLDCYGDAVCHCADQALDACLTPRGEAADASASIARCWNAFSTIGAIAQQRIACQRLYCQAECAVP